MRPGRRAALEWWCSSWWAGRVVSLGSPAARQADPVASPRGKSGRGWLAGQLSQIGGPLDDKASALVRGGDIVPISMTPSLVMAGATIANEVPDTGSRRADAGARARAR